MKEANKSISLIADHARHQSLEKGNIVSTVEPNTEYSTKLQIQMSVPGDTELEITNKISEHDENQNSLSTQFSDAFEWLEPILDYCPIWITKPSDKQTTNKTMLNYFGLLVSVVFVLLYFVLQFFYQITGWNIYSDVDNIIWCCYIVCVSTSRLLSILYCYKYFNSPWKHESLPFKQLHVQQTGSNIRYKALIARWKNINISLAAAYIILDISVVILETWALLPYYHDTLFTYIAVKSLCRLFLLYPQLITAMIQSIILLKYYVCLDQLYENMKNNMSNVDLQYVFEDYSKLYNLFKRDYHKTFKFSVRFFLAAEVLFFWDSLNFIGMFVLGVILIRELPMFTLYFYAASILENAHRKFAKQLWKNSHLFLNKKENNDTCNGCYYNSILHHIQEYPIYLKFGSVVVSRNNVIKYSIGLFASRAIAYFFRHWVEENW